MVGEESCREISRNFIIGENSVTGENRGPQASGTKKKNVFLHKLRSRVFFSPARVLGCFGSEPGSRLRLG